MFETIKNKFKNISPEERLKILLLFFCYFCIIGCYTVLRTLRDSIFIATVGREYIQWAQIFSITLLIPALLLLAYFIDHFKKHQLLITTTIFFGTLVFLVAYYVGHPTIGISNTNTSFNRFFGWITYFFTESYMPFVTSIFLSFVHSIISPEAIVRSYPIIVTGSAVGGAIIALFSWIFLGSGINLHDSLKIKIVLIIAALLLLAVPLLILYLIKNVPEKFLHGYEASYSVDKKLEEIKKEKKGKWYSGIFSGLVLILRYPYVLGIFSIVVFWELTNMLVSFQRLRVCSTIYGTSIAKLSSILFLQDFWIQLSVMVFTSIIVPFLLTYAGQRRSLISAPILTGILLIFYFLNSQESISIILYVLFRAFNLAMIFSVREILYIPTTKDIKFKSKSWIDTFGNKCSKGIGSFMSLIVERAGQLPIIYISLCASILAAWTIVVNFLGKKFEKIIKDNEVIG